LAQAGQRRALIGGALDGQLALTETAEAELLHRAERFAQLVADRKRLVLHVHQDRLANSLGELAG
jgi:hypothetical protein